MLSYCCYWNESAKDVNLGPIMTKIRLILIKIKCFNCNHKKFCQQTLNYKRCLIVLSLKNILTTHVQ